jgi:hypothetical protein
MDTTILARFQCAISETMMASAASLRIGRAAHFPWWLAELQHAAHAPRASHSSAMQLGLRDLPAKTFRVPGQGAKPARAQSRPLLAHLRMPVSKRPANGDAKAHSSHPERSRCISSWTCRMSSRYTPISCRRTFDCTGGGSARFRVFRSSKVLERRHRNLAGKYILRTSLIGLGFLKSLSTVLCLG